MRGTDVALEDASYLVVTTADGQERLEVFERVCGARFVFTLPRAVIA